MEVHLLGGAQWPNEAQCIVTLGVATAAPEDPTFRDKIEPILKANCAGCHSGSQAQGGLSVTNLAELLKGGKRGPAISPGQAGQSLILQFVRGEKNPRMPIRGKALPEGVVAELAAAIDSMKAVEKALNMALRAIGKRTGGLRVAVVAVARRLAEAPSPTTSWVGRDALRG